TGGKLCAASFTASYNADQSSHFLTRDRRVKRKLPLAVKLLYTAFVCLLVPVYLRYYGPTNFLYFCDVALLMTVAALWLESSLLASMAAVGIVVPQLLWQVDFLGGLCGWHMLHLTNYMDDAFESPKKLLLRGLSFFHF